MYIYNRFVLYKHCWALISDFWLSSKIFYWVLDVGQVFGVQVLRPLLAGELRLLQSPDGLHLPEDVAEGVGDDGEHDDQGEQQDQRGGQNSLDRSNEVRRKKNKIIPPTLMSLQVICLSSLHSGAWLLRLNRSLLSMSVELLTKHKTNEMSVRNLLGDNIDCLFLCLRYTHQPGSYICCQTF